MRTSSKLLAVLLIGLFLSFSFNAYACLIPIYGDRDLVPESDCTTPGKEPSAQFCDGFKSLAVQASSDMPSGELSQFVIVGKDSTLFGDFQTSYKILHPAAQKHIPPSEDILVLISVFRI